MALWGDIQAKLDLYQRTYSHLSNKRGGWNKCGGGAKFAKRGG